MNEKHVIQRFVKAKKLFCKYALLLMLCSFGSTYAQNSGEKISGVILEEANGEVVLGASLFIEETKKSTISDQDGKFTIEAKVGETLTVTYIGFVTQKIKITGNKITIRLKEDISSLKEVVVIGYGKVQRKDLTGSISSVTGDELRKTAPVTFDQALQGKVAGMVVQQTSGQPGGGVNIQIRGLSSFGSSSPLYVIDGVIIGQSSEGISGTNPLATISPSDIESVDVLKDASATAIYGSQATNGVIVVTTKRGKEGASKVSYEFSTGFQELIRQYPTMDLREYAQLINDRSVVWGFDERPEFANPQYLGKGTNWQEELFRRAPTSNHVLTLSGGSNKTQYLLSGSYLNQEGIALGSKFNRASVRLNLDTQAVDWLKIGTSLQLTHVDENVNTSGSSVIQSALSQTPDIAVRNPDGSYAGEESNQGWILKQVNPVALALVNRNNPKRNQLFGNFYADLAFTKDLSFRNEVSGNFLFQTIDEYYPKYKFGLAERIVNESRYKYSQNYYTTFRSYLTYAKVFKDKYNVNLMVGHEAQLSQFEDVSAGRRNYISDDVTNIGSGDILTVTNDGKKGVGSAQESYFGRLNFILNDKYLFTANLRTDGSSKFAAGNHWVTTYSGAFAWKLNNENFLKGSKVVNQLKLRLGYGLTNNQNVRDNAYLSLLAASATALAGNAQIVSSLGNAKVKWERTEYSNAGIDASLFNWRLNLSVDVYNRYTDGLLMQIPLPLYSGTTTDWSPGSILAPYINIGVVRNRGIDLHLNSKNITAKDFSWSTDFTLSHNKNKVLKLNTDGASLPGKFNNEIVSQTVVGGSIGDFYGYKVDGGVFATSEDFDTHALPTSSDGYPLPITPNSGGVWYGDLKFKDLNGDGVITEKDRTYLGSPIPVVQLGLGNTFNYKGFDLNIFFSSNIGNEVVNAMRINGENPLTNRGFLKSLKDHAVVALVNPDGSASDYKNVYVTNPNTTIVGFKNNDSNMNNRFSDKYVEDGSFIRCKNISLGYRFPEKWIQKIHLTSFRVYANVTNAFLITKYKGMDPEVGSWNPLQAGIDNGFYPQPRTFTLGLNLGL